MKNMGEFYFALFFALLGLSILICSLRFQYWEAMTLPAILGGLLFISGSFETGKQLINKRRIIPNDIQNKTQNKTNIFRHAGFKLIIWIIAFMLAVYLFGILIAAPLFAVSYLLWRKRKWLVAIIFALTADAVIYLVFEFALRSELYRGLVFGG